MGAPDGVAGPWRRDQRVVDTVVAAQRCAFWGPSIEGVRWG